MHMVHSGTSVTLMRLIHRLEHEPRAAGSQCMAERPLGNRLSSARLEAKSPRSALSTLADEVVNVNVRPAAN
jgi:hypothetical protein